MAAFVVAAYMKAVPMVYNGQEVGYGQRVPFMGPRRPIDWTPNPALTAEYRRLLGLRNRSAALRTGQLTSFSSRRRVHLYQGAGPRAGADAGEPTRPARNLFRPGRAGAARRWFNAFDGQAASLAGTLTLQPFQYLVLRNELGPVEPVVPRKSVSRRAKRVLCAAAPNGPDAQELALLVCETDFRGNSGSNSETPFCPSQLLAA